MKVLPDQLALDFPAIAQPSPAPADSRRPNPRQAQAPVKIETTVAAPNIVSPVGSHLPDVTFRRDPNGRVYYVVSDAQSGKEIQELPPQAVRSVGEGIDEYLKREEAKTTPHLNVKA